MVLRSGIIIPFQYRDHKKLLMVGVPEENRDLGIWDLKNVVRDAFGIYECEFRNKKIGFHIPEKLLLHYLAQRQDLTNFVIEVEQANKENRPLNDNLSFEPSCSQKFAASTPQKSTDNPKGMHTPGIDPVPPSHAYPYDTNNSMDYSNMSTEPTATKLRLGEPYVNAQTPETLTHSINPMNIKADASEPRYENRLQTDQPPSYHHPNYNESMLDNHNHELDAPYSAATLNKFRKRGERISRDQKEIYVKYVEENPCMITQRLNDSLLEPHWKKLSDIMNSVPQGAMKSVEEWKNTFYTWRYRVFMLVRHNSKLAGSAAHNPKNFKQITAIDQRAYALWTSHKHAMQQDFDKIDMKRGFNY